MATNYAPRAYHLLKGVFAVYKPSGQPIHTLMKEIRTRLLLDINSMEQRPQKQMILFQPASSVISGQVPSENKTDVAVDISKSESVPVSVPDWFDHPLVQGRRYTGEDFEFSAGHLLDVYACGVQVLGLHKSGAKTLEKLRTLNIPKKYRVKGEFGMASLTFSGESRIVERSTWDHITESKLDRVITIIHGNHRNACIKGSGLDISSQKAYVMASKGVLKPMTPTSAMILDIKLISFNLPEFTIDVTCINESSIYVRKLIHRIGLELKSTAICTHLQRLNDSVFTVNDPHTLLGDQLNCNSVIDSIRHGRFLLQQGVMKRSRHFRKIEFKLKNDKVKRNSLLESDKHDDKLLNAGIETADSKDTNMLNNGGSFDKLSSSNSLNG